MSGIFGDIPNNLSMPAGTGVRRNAGDTDFESYTPAVLLTYNQSSASRSLNTNFQPSTTRNVLGVYSVEIAATLSLSGGQTGTVFLEISADGSTGWVELSRATNGNTGTLTVGLNITQTGASTLVGTVPAGYFVRLRTTGTATITYRSGQETTI